MTRAAWALLQALIGSNVAWIATAPAAPSARAPRARSRLPELRARLTRLENELTAVAGESASQRPTPRVSAAYASREEAWERAKPWIEDLLQITDPGKHVATLQHIRAALGSEDPVAVEAALLALAQAREVRFDKEPFRPLVLPHLESAAAGVRLAALFALVNTKALPEDVARVLPLAEDREADVRTMVPYILAILTGGDLTGASGEALLKLLHDPDWRLVVDAMRGLGIVTKLPPAVVDRLFELASDREKRQSVLHFALMNLPKHRRVIDAMLSYLDEGSSLDTVGLGLQRGIPDDLKDYLCQKILVRLEEAPDEFAQRQYLEILRFHADSRHRAALQRHGGPVVEPIDVFVLRGPGGRTVRAPRS